MRKSIHIAVLALLAAILVTGCRNPEKEPPQDKSVQLQPQPPRVEAPLFNADSAYTYIEKQVSFGPRVPNTPAQEKCASYLAAKLRQYTPNVVVQEGVMPAYNGKQLKIKNIIADINPERRPVVLLVSHWDSRPWADQDSVNMKKPIDAANDGASGVAVLIEIARQLKQRSPEIGIKILLVDAEDYGTPEFDRNAQSNTDDTYCLGTQFWAKSLNKTQYVADYGIVLDMVGAKDARFLQEANSRKYAQYVLDKVWRQAQMLGFSNYFVYNQTYPITDDHDFVNNIANIPCIDIVDYDASRPKGFGYYWHTHADNMQVIDKATLRAVGQTLLSLIFNEQGMAK